MRLLQKPTAERAESAEKLFFLRVLSSLCGKTAFLQWSYNIVITSESEAIA